MLQTSDLGQTDKLILIGQQQSKALLVRYAVTCNIKLNLHVYIIFFIKFQKRLSLVVPASTNLVQGTIRYGKILLHVLL